VHPATVRWLFTLGATAGSTYALEALATGAGLAVLASGVLDGTDHGVLLTLVAATYGVWAVALRANLAANWRLIEATGTSTNAVSMAAYELAKRRTRRPAAPRIAAAAGYVGTELAKEVPYYLGAFGAAVVSDSLSSAHALAFLAGTNVGAAAYEYGVARLTRAFLSRSSARRGEDAGAVAR
jgi:hypothetical protein